MEEDTSEDLQNEKCISAASGCSLQTPQLLFHFRDSLFTRLSRPGLVTNDVGQFKLAALARNADESHIGTVNLSVGLMILCGARCTHGPALKRISNKTNQKRDLDQKKHFCIVELLGYFYTMDHPRVGRKTSNQISLRRSRDTLI